LRFDFGKQLFCRGRFERINQVPFRRSARLFGHAETPIKAVGSAERIHPNPVAGTTFDAAREGDGEQTNPDELRGSLNIRRRMPLSSPPPPVFVNRKE
jgi:hypothetical protein